MRLFTAGYQGLTVLKLSRMLRAAGAKIVIDVRHDVHRVGGVKIAKGYAMAELEPALEADQLDYVHIEAAGNPYRSGLFHECMKQYRQHLQRTHGDKRVAAVVREALDEERPPVLLCACQDAHWCHRGVLVELVVERLRPTHPLSVIHLPLREEQPGLFEGPSTNQPREGRNERRG